MGFQQMFSVLTFIPLKEKTHQTIKLFLLVVIVSS
jgi:hypothetical protein